MAAPLTVEVKNGGLFILFHLSVFKQRFQRETCKKEETNREANSSPCDGKESVTYCSEAGLPAFKKNNSTQDNPGVNMPGLFVIMAAASS